MDSNKNSQTTCINVVDCKIVTEVCQLFFCVRCVWVVSVPGIRAAVGSDCPALLFRSWVELVFTIASKTRSYQYKRFSYPILPAISCKRVLDLECLSNNLNLLCIILYHISYMMSRFSSRKTLCLVRSLYENRQNLCNFAFFRLNIS